MTGWAELLFLMALIAIAITSIGAASILISIEQVLSLYYSSSDEEVGRLREDE